VDFISLDGFGGGTGATEFFVRENVGIPIAVALPRVDRHLKNIGLRDGVSLIAGGGLRTSADFAKCLALGADAVYIGTSALIAINCQQYRICHTGRCPTGVTTNDPILVQQLNVEEGVRRLTNFINVSNIEVSNLLRIVGKDDIEKLSGEDIVALTKEAAEATGVKWMNGNIV
jgi:methylamine---glutamate N-methyltransferase subunit C